MIPVIWMAAVLLGALFAVACAMAIPATSPATTQGETNTLTLHGPLVVTEGKRHLTHRDGTPFLWIGDTAWNTAFHASMPEWREYIDARASQGFNVVQVHATHSKEVPEKINRNGHAPFDESGAPVAAYWQDLREKIRHANERGLVVLLVGVGVPQQEEHAQQMATESFARYIGELLKDEAVILSPSMDRPHDERNDHMVAWLKAAAPNLLVTQHPNNTLPPALAYHHDLTLDFSLYQSGHSGGKADPAYAAAFDFPAALLAEEPLRPIINSEAMYDGTGTDQRDQRDQGNQGDPGDSWSGRHARQLGWISLLNGSAGYTYGAGETRLGGKGGIWKFNRDEKAFDYWRRALKWKSAEQVGHMARFFAAVAWWRLQPAMNLVLNQSPEPQKRISAAMTDDSTLLIAFVPHGSEIVLDLSRMPKKLNVRCFDPQTGEWAGPASPIFASANIAIPMPRAGEWVLKIEVMD